MNTRIRIFAALAATLGIAGCNVVLGLDDYAQQAEVCTPGTQKKCLYTGPAGTEDIGVCRAGYQICNEDGMGYGACTGEVLPVTEDCTTKELDEDCDGVMNDGCACMPGQTRSCYPDAAGQTEGIGICAAGTEICTADFTWSGMCMGAVTPKGEDCATAADEDCDGKSFDDTEDGCLCQPGTPAPCYTGPVGTEGVGLCKAGMGTCNATGTAVTSCMGDITPQPVDNCNVAGDEDCSGSGCSDHRFSYAFGNIADQYTNLVTTDPAGNVIIVGGFYGGIQLGPNQPIFASVGDADLFIAKFDNQGTPLWSKTFGDVAEQTATSVATDAQGNLYVSGYFAGTVDFGNGFKFSTSNSDGFVAKFDPEGNVLWVRQYDGLMNERFWSIAVDSKGDAIVTGWRFNNDPNATSYLIVKLASADGGNVWSPKVSNDFTSRGMVVAVDSADSIYVAGELAGAMNFEGTVHNSNGGSKDVFLAKFSSVGTLSWFKEFGDSAAQDVEGLAVDKAGNVIMSGHFQGNMSPVTIMSGGSSDVYVIKHDPAGVHIKSKRFGDASAQLGYRVATDPDDNIILTGTFAGSIDFGGGAFTMALGNDAFIAKFDKDLNHRWSKQFGAANNQIGYSVATDAAGHVFLAAHGIGPINFGGGPVNGGGSFDTFLASFEP